MPFRLLSYMVEIWRNILKNTPKNITSRKDFRLPAIIPMVLYNGEAMWTAAKSFKEILNDYEAFDDYIVNFSYLLFDVNRYDSEELKEIANLMALIFLLDQKYEIMELTERLKALFNIQQNLDSNDFQFQVQLILQWVKKIITLSYPEAKVDDIISALQYSSPEEVDTVISNLGETLRKARQDAIREGLEKGREEKQIEIAINLLKKNLPVELIVQTTGISLEELEILSRNLSIDKPQNE